jgi:hypothetical protein
MARTGVLDSSNRIASDVWIDRNDAPAVIDQKLANGDITVEEAEFLRKYWEDGYLIFDSKVDSDVLDRAVRNGRRLWAERPADLLGASVHMNNGRPMPMSLFPEDFKPSAGTRILDGHSHNPEFEILSSLPKLHRLIGLILGEKPVATQSLYFSYGSVQSLHRDPWYVVTTPISTLVACWVALEDISPDSGPLSFVPKSHRLPYKPLNTGDIIFHEASATPESKSEHINEMHASMKAQGMPVKQFFARKGEILIWHGSLVHGGSAVKNPELTRESYVIHFDAERVHKQHAQTIRIGAEPPRVLRTTEVMEKNGSLVFANPVKGKNLVAV